MNPDDTTLFYGWFRKESTSTRPEKESISATTTEIKRPSKAHESPYKTYRSLLGYRDP
jgi:hypothetical protein